MAVDAVRAKSLFLNASDLADPAERAAYLERECGGEGDAELRDRVEALLRANDAAPLPPPRPLEATIGSGPGVAPLRPAGTSDHRPQVAPGTIIAGRYKLLEEIGEGGMGAVWVAEQTQPVRRKVALKLIKAGMDSKSVLARFEAERQALAVMDHPNIAKVLDGGLTETGRPFFVMEYVKGVPITEYCDATRLSVPERLNLFVQVCHAVQHAHQKGIIHRDLKPSNILVAPYDDKPVPKVIDFGLAKAMHQSLTERTLHTAHETVLGTPLYISPEQAQLNNLDVDTRSDIYSLGVLLYELLTGTTPLEKQRFKEAAWDEIKRIIREEEAPRPSTRLSSSHTLASLAVGRQTEPARLTKLVRGELDWIVMKALEKDRSRRYDTANGFAMDIQRYLAGEPVLAAPPSARYRLGKFARKHRAGLTTAAALALLLVTGVAVSTWQAVRATRAEQVAIQARLEEAERAEGERLAKLDAEAKRAEADRQKVRAEKAQQAEADRAEGERLAKLEAQAQKAKAEQAAAAEKAANEQAQKRLTQIEKASDILGSIFENLDPAEIARAERPLQAILVEKLDQAVAQLEGESIGDPLVVAAMQDKFGLSLVGLGESGKAIVLLEKARAARRANLGPEHRDTLNSMHHLALAYRDARKLDLALPLLEETLKLRKANLGPEHRDTLASMNGLAVVYREAGKLDVALPLLEETLKLRKAKFGPEHLETLTSMDNLGSAYREAGKLDVALPLLEETLKLWKAKIGPEHPGTLYCMNNLAVAYGAVGKLDLALPLLEETLKLTKAKLGPEHPDTLLSMNNLALAYRDARKLDLALPLLEETLKLRKAKLGPEKPQTMASMANLGKMYCDANQGEKAAATLKELVAGQRKLAPPDDPQFAGLLAEVALDLLKCRQHAAAEEMLRECLAIRAKKEPEVWTTFNTKSLLGGALLGQKKYTDAEPLLLKGYEGMKQRDKTIPPPGMDRIPEAIERLVQLYEATDKKDEAAKWRKTLENQAGKRVGPVHEVGQGLELRGQLDKQTPTLVYQVKLAAGKTYVIDMVSPDQNALDPYLVLTNATGKTLAKDDDSGGGLNARITFGAEQAGTFRIHATSFNAGVGPFTLTVREMANPPKEKKK